MLVLDSETRQFEVIAKESAINPLPSAAVTKVYQDRLGYIWIAAYSKGLVRYDGHTMKLYTTDDGLPSPYLWSIIEDNYGRLWVGTDAGVVVSEKPLVDYSDGSQVRFVGLIGETDLAQSEVMNPGGLAKDTRGLIEVTPSPGREGFSPAWDLAVK